MRALIVHERYRHRGGEDIAVDAEVALLARGGVDIRRLIVDNRLIPGSGVSVLPRLLWSRQGYADVREAIREFRPDLLHVHNTFPLLSPSVHDAARSLCVPSVQTLHNFRLLCANALLLRDARPCEDCVSRAVPWPAVVHACYRDSIAGSAAMAALVGFHAAIGTWRRKVDRFIALSDASARVFVAGGLPTERIAVQPPVVADPGPAPAASERRAGVLFVGRLSPEKGLETVLEAWGGLSMPLDVIGDAAMPGEPRVRSARGVRFLGRRAPEEVSEAMSRAALLVFPSLCRENFPLVVAEAMAHGLPVLASAGGAVEEVLEAGVTGEFVSAGDPRAWSLAVGRLMADPVRLRRMGVAARRVYEEKYAPERTLSERLALYRKVLSDHHQGTSE